MPKFTKIDINSVTIKDDDGGPDPKLAFSWEYEKIDDNEISEIEITMPLTVMDTVDITNGQTLEVWAGNTTSTDLKYFNGFVDDIIPEGALVRVIGKNAMVQLVRKNVNKVYDSGIDASAGEVSEIAEDLIETFGGMNGTVQSSGTEDGIRVDVFKCVNTDIWERLVTLKRALDWQIRYDDANDVVHFEPRAFVDSGITLNTSIELIGNPEWDFDTTNMINDLRVDGASTQTNITENGKIETTANYLNESILLTKTPDIVELLIDAADPPTTQKEGGTKDASTSHFYYIDRENKKIMPKTGTTFTTDHFAIINYTWSAPAPIHMRNQESVDNYGLFQKQVDLPDVASVADAESRGASILNRRSIPFVTGKLLVKSTSTPNVGELVNVIDTKSVKDPSGQYVVNKVLYKWPSGTEEIEVGDAQWRLADWQSTTEDRLKRLEEQFVRNQDILLELVNIQNTSTENLLRPTSRYRKVLERTLVGDGFILGHSSYGILGTSTLGDDSASEVDSFIQQFENIYIETFVDEDFESSNTTADWSNTGSVDFTSGEIAESESIDFNNSTITTATLTPTEVSGAFKYEMMADGSNWEEIAIPQAHYKLNDNAVSTVVLDAIGSNNGTANANTSTLTTPGKINQAFSFDSSNPDTVVVSDDDLFDKNTISISMWIKTSDDDQDVLRKWESSGDERSWAIWIDNSSKLRFSVSSNGIASASGKSTTSVDDDNWHHVVVTFDASDIRVYVDNSLEDTDSLSGNLFASTSDIKFGDSFITANNYDGEMDDVRIYSKVLSTTDITILYNSNSGTEEVFNPHTFANTGTDLRWRATENSASTGEISNILIEDYH